MSEDPQPESRSQFLGAFAGVVTLLSIALYFTGWIYRWAYFGFFRIQLITLDFPAQSFFIIPIQVFLGSPQAFIRAVMLLSLAVLGINFTLGVFTRNTKKKDIIIVCSYPDQGKKLYGRITRRLSKPLFKELVIVAWILIALYWTARWQGVTDAWQAAVNDTSSLPIVTLAQVETGLGLGYNPKNQTYPSLEKVRIIGNVGLFTDKLRGREAKFPGEPSQTGDWRFLIRSKGWLYLFQALPPNVDRKEHPRPPILVVREGGGQFMILSPSASDE